MWGRLPGNDTSLSIQQSFDLKPARFFGHLYTAIVAHGINLDAFFIEILGHSHEHVRSAVDTCVTTFRYETQIQAYFHYH